MPTLTPQNLPNTTRSFRIVATENQKQYVHDLLKAQGYIYTREPFADDCYQLVEEPKPLGNSWAAFFGYIYIQDRSSMLPPLGLNVRLGESIVDVCASPGSKTSFLAQLTGQTGCVLANEPNPKRLTTLRQNIQRLNLLQVCTANVQGQNLNLKPNSLTAIALDPPCSGWGTVAKHPKVTSIWKESNTKTLVALQRLILNNAATLLKPNGRLLYSTCTTHELENEAQVEYCERALDLVVEPLPKFKGFSFESTKKGTLRINAEQSNAQGFFLALLRKKAQAAELSDEFAKEELDLSAQFNFSRENLAINGLDLTKLPPGYLQLRKDQVFFWPKASLEYFRSDLKVRGFLLGSWHKNYFTPHARLRALAKDLPNAATDIILDELQDIERLFAGQSLPTTLDHKVVMIWWKNLPLGFGVIKQGRLLAKFN